MPKNKIKFLIFLWLGILSVGRVRADGWMETSQAIFFPPDLGEKLQTYTAFPLTWWSFLVLDQKDEKDFAQAREVCRTLKSRAQPWISAAECDDDLGQYLPTLLDWARDYPLRHDLPGEEASLDRFNASLAKASLPLDRAIFELLRTDPFESYLELKKLLEQKSPLNLKRKRGFFYDEEAKRVAIPVKFNFPPAETEKTEKFIQAWHNICQRDGNCDRWGLIGSHASSLENKTQIMRDVAWASSLGAAYFLLFFALLAIFRKWQVLVIFPIVFLSVGLSCLITIAVFGSIHGLTLSFGVGIVGIALDYGLLSALNPRSKNIWKSNLCGFLTTVSVLLILMLSSIPLLRQMMFFSSVGLAIAFVTLFLLHRRTPRFSDVKLIDVRPRASRVMTGLVAVLVLASVVGVVITRPTLDLEKLNFQTEKVRDLTRWFFAKAGSSAPLIQIHPEKNGEWPLLAGLHEAEWAQANGVRVENIGRYLPSATTQAIHLRTWLGDPCHFAGSPIGRVSDRWTYTERSFFKPFVNHMQCEEVGVLGRGKNIPAYLTDLNTEGNWLTLWFPKSDEEVAQIQKQFPDATSLKSLVSFFPETLAREISWMAPLALLVVWLLHFAYYRKVTLSTIAFIPFFSAVGLSFLLGKIFQWEVTFVSLIGLTMLIGLSVDYGIFATDIARQDDDKRKGTWTAISVAALTTISGFVPLLFCKHQILTQLGQVLAFGTIGTVIGAVWGVPVATQFFRKRGLV